MVDAWLLLPASVEYAFKVYQYVLIILVLSSLSSSVRAFKVCQYVLIILLSSLSSSVR